MYVKGQKKCRTCGITKDYRSYYKARINADGYENRCKPCKKEAINPDHRKAYIRKWRREKVDMGHYGRCVECGGNLGRGTKRATKLCRACCVGENHPHFAGGYINEDGYIVYPKGKYSSVMRHRQVMEDYLGRKLAEDETIHHKNGVRDDNRIENLEIWVGAPVRGMRQEDAVAWAKKIIKRYEGE